MLWLKLHCSFTKIVVKILEYPPMVKEQEDKGKETVQNYIIQ